MIKEYFKDETYEVTDSHMVGSNLFCDGCKNQIGEKRKSNGFLSPTAYIHVFCGHHDWGNDSVDSFKYKDFCSHVCMMKHQEKFWEENCTSSSAFYEIQCEEWHEDIYEPDGTERMED